MVNSDQNQNTASTMGAGKAINGSYGVTVDTNGVFITVYPPQGEGKPVDHHTIYEELIAKNLHTVKEEAIIRAVSSPSPNAVCVGAYPGPEEPEVKIEITTNKMEASLTIIPSRSGGVPSLKEIKEHLEAAGVVHGIDEAQIRLALEQLKKPVVVANGSPAEDGVNARIEHAFDYSNIGKPKEQDDGSVDFHDLNLIYNIRAEDIIAAKIPRTEGVPGTSVTGDVLPTKPGKDLPFPLGKNVYADAEGKIRASIDGQIQITNGKIHVAPVFEIRNDVDVSTGSIDFVGSVIVRGSVQMGFAIKASGDIEVCGTVSGATLEGTNILVRNGIQGMQRGHIRARGNVTAKFIENANVHAQEAVTVAEAILHSNVSGGKRVAVQGKRGVIVGGCVRAGEEIITRLVGSHFATPTTLEVGVNPELRDELSKARKEMKEVQQNLDQTQKAVQLLKNLELNGTITQEKKEMLLRVTKSYYNLMGQHELLKNRILEIEVQIDELRYGKIKVAETMHPGVKIVIGSAVLPVRDPIQYATLYEADGHVKVGLYK
jgi:uncharacterized protein